MLRSTPTENGPGPLRAAATRPDPLPLSPAQRRLWFLDRVGACAAAYNIPLALRMSGAPDEAALRAALADLVHRHESLRTVFPDVDGEPRQHVLAPARAVPRWEARRIAPGELAEALREAALRRFDLSAEPPLRTWLFDPGDGTRVLLIVLHHIAGDGGRCVRWRGTWWRRTGPVCGPGPGVGGTAGPVRRLHAVAG